MLPEQLPRLRDSSIVTVSYTHLDVYKRQAYDHVVIPLHGEISRPESIVLSRDSYQKLYNTDSFKSEFEHMRTHFTFLFMGFSFEDKYIRKLFDKILHHYQAQHFILFDKSEADKNAEKIERIKTQYGIETVFYDALKKGHIDGCLLYTSYKSTGFSFSCNNCLILSGREDVYKRQDGFRGEANENLTADHAYKVGRFLGWYYGELKRQNGDDTPARIIIGKDTRRSVITVLTFQFSVIPVSYTHLR